MPNKQGIGLCLGRTDMPVTMYWHKDPLPPFAEHFSFEHRNGIAINIKIPELLIRKNVWQQRKPLEAVIRALVSFSDTFSPEGELGIRCEGCGSTYWDDQCPHCGYA